MIEKILTRVADACQRYEDRKAVRIAAVKSAAQRKYQELNHDDRFLKRLLRLGAPKQVARSLLRGEIELTDVLAESDLSTPARLGLERLLSDSDLLEVNFLQQGATVAQAVGRVIIRLGGGVTEYGTGFLVAPGVLLTNNHVVASREQAASGQIQFNYEENEDDAIEAPFRFELAPDLFFVTSKRFDCTFVAVADLDDKLAQFGFCPLIEEQGKVTIGEHVNIIQHPDGRPKEIAIRDNKLVDIPEGADASGDFLYYSTDTEPGSSGAPVFNDQWEVVAMHHTAVPKRRNNRFLTRDNRVWKEGMDPALLQFVANEGVRVSRLVRFLKTLELKTAEQRALRNTILEAEGADRLVGGHGMDTLPVPRRAQPDRDASPRRIRLPLSLVLEVEQGTVLAADSSQRTSDTQDSQLEVETPETDSADGTFWGDPD